MFIGNVEIQNPVVLAPMAGVTDLPFRLLCKEMDCGLLYTEMVSAKAILYGNKNTEALMQVTPKEHPIALQLFGSDPEVMGEIAKRVEDAGAAAIAVHGRTRQQYYSGIADWETIAKVKEAVSIPVIGNGDVDSPKKAEKLFRQTGCDAVMIGRAVEGNPWIFREMNHYFATGEELARPSLAEVKAMILKHARAQIEMKGEFIGIREMRKHVAWYTAGMPHSAGLRRESNNIESYADLEKLLERL